MENHVGVVSVAGKNECSVEFLQTMVVSTVGDFADIGDFIERCPVEARNGCKMRVDIQHSILDEVALSRELVGEGEVHCQNGELQGRVVGTEVRQVLEVGHFQVGVSVFRPPPVWGDGRGDR